MCVYIFFFRDHLGFVAITLTKLVLRVSSKPAGLLPYKCLRLLL